MPKPVVLKGLTIHDDVPFRDAGAQLALAGFDGAGRSAFLPVGETLLGRHALLLGSGGCGKTNMMLSLARVLRAGLSPDDTMIVLDMGGAYRRAVFQKNDTVPEGGNGWSLFAELNDDDSLVEEADEIVGALFSDRLRKSVNPAYTAAARDLLMALIVYIKRSGDAELACNRALRGLVDGFDTDSMRRILTSQPELAAFAAYIRDDDGDRTLGIASELQRAAREIFRGDYATEGGFSAREFVRSRGGKALFIECAPSDSERSAPAAMCGLCIKEALEYTGKGKTYIMLDGLCAMPEIPRLTDALLCGRDRGIRMIVSASDMKGLITRYGADAPATLASAGTIFAFRSRDKESRAFVKSLYGRHRVIEGYRPAASYNAVQYAVDEYLIGDEELSALGTGESIVAASGLPPFRFRTKPYGA